MEEQPETVVSNGSSNRKAENKDRIIQTVLQEINNQEDIDLLISRLQTKKSQVAMMNKNMNGCATTEEATLLPPEEPLDWVNIQGEDLFTKMMFSD